MVMRTMRENTKWIMLVTALAFVALMVFEWGMDLTGQSGTQLSGGEVGRVNGQPVTYQEYISVYRNLYDQQAAGGQPVSSALNDQIEDAAWQQIVMQRLLLQELRRRGIRVTDAEVRQAARLAPPPEFQTYEGFQTDGQFDFNKYYAFLSSPTVDTDLLGQLEAYYRDAIPRSKLYYQTTAGVYVTDAELWRMWRDTHETARIRYLAFDPAVLVPDEAVTVSDQDIGAFYEANQDDFLRPAQATVRYLVLDRSPTAADTVAARQRAEQIRQQLAAGEPFEQVAASESADTAAGGGLTTLVRGQTHPALEQAAFSGPVGQVSEPILTPAGLHMIRVESREGDQAEIRQIVVPIELSLEAEGALLDRADSLDVLAATRTLEEIGRLLNLEVRTAELIPGLSFVPGVGATDDGTDWVFEEATPGDVSDVFETPSAYYVFELLQKADERTLSLEEAEPTIRSAVRARKKLERAREIAREALDRINAGESWETVAAAYDIQPQEAGPFTRADFVPGLGRLNPAIGTAFGLRTAQTSGVVESDRRLYIIELLERQDADRAAWEAQKEDQRAGVREALAQQRWDLFLAALRNQAEIVDLRDDLAQQQQVATS